MARYTGPIQKKLRTLGLESIGFMVQGKTSALIKDLLEDEELQLMDCN